MRHLKAIGVGSLILIMVLFFVVGPSTRGPLGGDIGFVEFLGLAVLCTFGLVLIPFFLCAWSVGMLVVSFIDMTTSEPNGLGQHAPAALQEEGRKGLAPPNKRIRSLVTFIEKLRSQGVGEPEIKRILSFNGWSNAQVDEAYRCLGR